MVFGFNLIVIIDLFADDVVAVLVFDLVVAPVVFLDDLKTLPGSAVACVHDVSSCLLRSEPLTPPLLIQLERVAILGVLVVVGK